MKLHSLRWLIWALLAAPLGIYVYQNPTRHLHTKILIGYGIGVFSTLAVTIMTVSLVDLWRSQQEMTFFLEFALFFAYQKSALFLNAYLGLIIIINLFKSVELLDAKLVELSDLKIDYQSVADRLKGNIERDNTSLIQIKIGNKVKHIPLASIIWVQSDDYCVKLHTTERSYHLRKSMKLIEEQLEPKGFVRLHRNAIVNRQEVDTLVYSPQPSVTLKNGHVLPIATSRIARIKELFNGYLGLPA